jgi:hypothetical protein
MPLASPGPTSGTEDKFTIPCFLCRRPMQWGRNRHQGRHISGWKLSLCLICYDAAENGFAGPDAERIMKHLEANRIAPPAGARKGRLPRP